MQNDILFDNIYIGHSIEDAEKLKAETFDIKRPIEAAEEEASKPKREAKGEKPATFKEDPLGYARGLIDEFITVAKEDPIEAVKVVPEVAGGLGVLLITLVLIVGGAIGLSSPAPAPATKKDGKKDKGASSTDKDKVAEAVSTAAENTKDGATKRKGKSSD